MRSGWRDWWPEAGWAAFTLVSLALMLAVPRWQPIPFHLIWVSLTVLYGLRLWAPRPTAVLLACVGVLTGAAVATVGEPAEARAMELAEVPLMAVMFMIMVWHARQRSYALSQVRRAAERERDFVRDASHQLRTPITVARGHAALVARAHPGSETAHDTEIILSELERLQRISDRLLILASAEHPGFLMLEPVALGELVDGAAARWAAVADREWAIDARSTGTVLVDRARIDCALDALIENAIKATAAGDAIALRAVASGGEPTIVVADQGIGVALEHRERIFERFARAPGAAGAAGARRNGTGLGLPIVKAIAEAHDGTVVVVDAPEGWTTFELRLARFERHAHAAWAGDPAGAAPTPLSHPAAR
jgi:signal transduction histidine kinase